MPPAPPTVPRAMLATLSRSAPAAPHPPPRALAGAIAAFLPADGRVEIQPGLTLFRLSRPTAAVHSFSVASFCVIAQGAKEVRLGEDRLLYDPRHYLIGTLGLPTVSRILRASPAEPYLSLRLALEPAQVTAAMTASGFAPRPQDPGKALAVSPLEPELLDACLRLLRQAREPAGYRVLGALTIQEIIYRLLRGNQGHRLGQLALGEGRDHRVARAIRHLREHFSEPFKVSALAHEVGMSVSSFHAHFRAVTALSPLQFLKRLRLQEARRLMLASDVGAAEAGFQVGYEDAAHFNREYRRDFGVPPLRDVQSLRAAGPAALPA